MTSIPPSPKTRSRSVESVAGAILRSVLAGIARAVVEHFWT